MVAKISGHGLGAGGIPPGIQKKVDSGKALPPGLEGKFPQLQEAVDAKTQAAEGAGAEGQAQDAPATVQDAIMKIMNLFMGEEDAGNPILEEPAAGEEVAQVGEVATAAPLANMTEPGNIFAQNTATAPAPAMTQATAPAPIQQPMAAAGPPAIYDYPNAGSMLTPNHTLYPFISDTYGLISKYRSPVYSQPLSVSLGMNPYA